ncbi:hypothetical protein FRC07_011342, partial [Ceratobasidium sp. 392]
GVGTDGAVAEQANQNAFDPSSSPDVRRTGRQRKPVVQGGPRLASAAEKETRSPGSSSASLDAQEEPAKAGKGKAKAKAKEKVAAKAKAAKGKGRD